MAGWVGGWFVGWLFAWLLSWLVVKTTFGKIKLVTNPIGLQMQNNLIAFIVLQNSKWIQTLKAIYICHLLTTNIYFNSA